MKKNITIDIIFMLLLCGMKVRSQIHSVSRAASSWKIGMTLYSFKGASFKQPLSEANKVGAEYVEGFSFHKLGDEFDNMPFGAFRYPD